jgi:hypothetical protein
MTAQQDPEIVPFSKFIGALDPWLEQVVLIGGWAHRLYRLDSRARNLEYPPWTTLDGDVAVPTRLKVEESNVRKRLLEAGFQDRPPRLGAKPALSSGETAYIFLFAVRRAIIVSMRRAKGVRP